MHMLKENKQIQILILCFTAILYTQTAYIELTYHNISSISCCRGDPSLTTYLYSVSVHILKHICASEWLRRHRGWERFGSLLIFIVIDGHWVKACRRVYRDGRRVHFHWMWFVLCVWFQTSRSTLSLSTTCTTSRGIPSSWKYMSRNVPQCQQE